MWALIVLLAIGFGWSLIRLLPFEWQRLEAAAASLVVGFVLAPWLYFVLAWLFGWQFGLTFGTGLMAAVVAVSLLRIKQRLKFAPMPRLTWKRGGLWILAVAVAWWMCSLVASSYSFRSSGGWSSNGNVWGDSPLHVALVTQFAHGMHLDLVAPYYQHVALTYPFMPDLWSGVLMRFTDNWIAGLTAPTMLMMLSLLVMLFYAAKRLLNSELGAWLAWYMLVFSGSLAGVFRVLWQLATKQGDYRSVMLVQGRATTDTYVNFFYSHPLPQRSYLFGMPLLLVAGLIALELYRQRRAGVKHRRRLQLAGGIAGLLVGLMPLVHSHSFVVMAGMLGLAAVLIWWRERRLPIGWAPMLGLGAALAIPQFVWQAAHSYHQGFSHWIWGWVVINDNAAHANWLLFWLASIGWLMVMIVAGWYFLRRIRVSAEVWFVYLVGLAIFGICNLYVFQPSIWDNMKLFEYSFWFIMLVTAAVMVAWCRYWWGKLLTGGLMLSLCAMGFVTLVLSGSLQDYPLLSGQEVTFGNHMRTALPSNAYLLVGDRHNSPITMLADRKVVMTYGGWYNLYAADWPQTYADRQTMLQGSDGALALINKYGANFAAFSDSEIAGGSVNLNFFQSHFQVFDYEAGWWVFDLRHPL
jgi:hypothetical protein